jgi:hypothetical protein
MVGHEGQRKSTGNSDACRELPCEEIDHGDGKGSENERNDSKVPFGFSEWIELMSKDKKQGRMKIS